MNEWEWQLLEDRQTIECVTIEGVEVKCGGRVRLRPRSGGDIFDLALAGRVATLESIEQDYEGKVHLAVVLEDDPGKDLGMLRQPGHRFFFTPDEVEPVPQPTILVAGIGNIFLGDDGFGVEVIRRLSNLPKSVAVKDFGIRSYDLAYALLEGYDVVILVDSVSRGDAPGTVYVIEPEVPGEPAAQEPVLDAHAMNPASVLRMAKSMGTVSSRILLVGCEPASLGGEQGEMGLSEVVSAAVDEAVRVIERLSAGFMSGKPEQVWETYGKGRTSDGRDAQHE
jgi:hydrogenase maturation protease